MADDRSLGHHPSDLSEPEAPHEDRDEKVGAIVEVAVGFMLLTAASIFVLIGLLPHFELHVSANQGPPTVANINARQLPPEPRLQDNAVEDLQQMRVAEDRILSNYGWIDQKKGIVRIPIDRAIDLLAQRGLPVRTARGTLSNAGNVSSPARAGRGSEVP